METALGQITKESDGYKVVFNRTFDHPIEKVWDAITDPEQLKYWFTDIEMDFRSGGKITIRFRDQENTSSYGTIEVIDPPHKFVWTWEGELAIWELKKEHNNITHLTFSYSKLPPDFAINAPAGFHALLDRLENRLDGSETTYPFGTEEKDPEQVKMQIHYAAAAYQHYPEIVQNKPVEVEKTYDAPVERVWQAMTDKEQMKQWYFDLDDFKLEKGFRFQFPGQGHKGEQYIHLCTITEIIPQKELQYSWEYEGFSGYSLVTFALSEDGKKTKLKLTHHGLETFPDHGDDFSWKSFNEGWNYIAKTGLSAFLEKS